MKLMKGIDESVFTYDYLEGYGIQYNSYSHIKEVEGAKHFFVFEFALIIDKTKRTVKIKSKMERPSITRKYPERPSR
jgi:hypothetical protein